MNASILPLTGREDLSFEVSHVTAGGMLHIASPQLSQNALRIRQVMGTYRHIAHDIGWDKAYDNGSLSIAGGYDFTKNNFRYRVMSLPGQPYERLQDADTEGHFIKPIGKMCFGLEDIAMVILRFRRMHNMPMQVYRLLSSNCAVQNPFVS